jgi:hypothetical protein
MRPETGIVPMETCTKTVGAVFGTAFLIALLSVPVTTTTSRTRQDEGSNLVVRTTYPRESSMFLPRYLSTRAHPPAGTTVHLRPTPWVATMVIVLVLGLVDYVFFCRLLPSPSASRKIRRSTGKRAL